MTSSAHSTTAAFGFLCEGSGLSTAFWTATRYDRRVRWCGAEMGGCVVQNAFAVAARSAGCGRLLPAGATSDGQAPIRLRGPDRRKGANCSGTPRHAAAGFSGFATAVQGGDEAAPGGASTAPAARQRP